jgi:hypothetical protein
MALAVNATEFATGADNLSGTLGGASTLILGGTATSIGLSDSNFSNAIFFSDLKIGSGISTFNLSAGSGTYLNTGNNSVDTIDLSSMGASSSATVDLSGDSNPITVIAGMGYNLLSGNSYDTLIVKAGTDITGSGLHYSGFGDVSVDYSLLTGANAVSLVDSSGDITVFGSLADSLITIGSTNFANLDSGIDCLRFELDSNSVPLSTQDNIGLSLTSGSALDNVATIDLTGMAYSTNTFNLTGYGGSGIELDGGDHVRNFIYAPATSSTLTLFDSTYSTNVIVATAGATNHIDGFTDGHDSFLATGIVITGSFDGNNQGSTASLGTLGNWGIDNKGANEDLVVNMGSNYTAHLLNTNATPTVAFFATIDIGNTSGVIHGGAGDDTFVWNLPSTSTALVNDSVQIDAGSGSDLLVLAGTITSSLTFDLSKTDQIAAGSNASISNFESVDATSLTVGSGTLVLSAGSGDHTLYGGSGSQILVGGSGSNVLVAGDYHNTLIGGGSTSSNAFVLNQGTSGSAPVQVYHFNPDYDLLDLPSSKYAGLGTTAIGSGSHENVYILADAANSSAAQSEVTAFGTANPTKAAILVVGAGSDAQVWYHNSSNQSYQLANVVGVDAHSLENHIAFASTQTAGAVNTASHSIA